MSLVKKKTMIKILEKRFVWLGKSLFFIDYILQNIINNAPNKDNVKSFVLNELIEDMNSFLMKDGKLNYDMIDFTPKIFAVDETIDYINSNKGDSDFLEEAFNSSFYNQKYYRLCEELTNIIFEKGSFSKYLIYH